MQSSRSKRLSSLLVFLAAVMFLAVGCSEAEGPEALGEGDQALRGGHGHNALGRVDDECLAEQSAPDCAATWEILQQLPDGYPLTDVGGSSSTDVYVVGWQMPHRFYLPGNSHGRIINYDGFQWVDDPTGPEATLHAIDVAPQGKLAYIVGSRGTIAQKLPGTSSWQVLPTSLSADLSDVFVDAKAKSGYAVGDNGTILRITGNRITQLSSGTTADLNAIWGNGGTFTVAGDAGTVLKGLPNGTLSPINSGTSANLKGIWGNGGTFIVVGEGGTLVELGSHPRTGGTQVATGTSADLNGIWGNGGTFVVAGDNGTVLVKTNRMGWTRVQLQFNGQPFTEDLTAVWGTSARDVFVTSDSGTVLHFGLH